MKQLLITIILFVFGCALNQVHAQAYQASRTVISSMGGTYGGSSFAGDFTISELAINTFGGTTGNSILSQGFHQGAELVGVMVPENVTAKLAMDAYPNPVRDVLTIVLRNAEEQKVELRVFSLSGQLIKTLEMEAMQLKVDMSGFKSGTYFIHAIDKSSGKRINTIKTQKL